jgi:hypothetical protein
MTTTPFALYRELDAEREATAQKVVKLEDALKPRIKLSFSAKDSGCVRPNTKINVVTHGMRGFVTCTYYRVRVDAISSVAVSGCSARLTEVHRNRRLVISGENIPLTFAPGEHPDTRSKTVHPNAPEHVDFLAITDRGEPMITAYQWTGPSSIEWETLLSETGTYKFHIVVTSPFAASEDIYIVLDWTGSNQTSTLEVSP